MSEKNTKIINKKYYSVAGGFRTAKYISALFLAVFLFCMYFIYSGEMTVDHFKYLLRNLEFNPNTVFSLGDSVFFDSDEENVCKSYKGGIAVLGAGKISLYDMTSSATLSEYHGYVDPRFEVSDKYILVYDTKSAKASVYSAFSHLKTLQTDKPIALARISDEGSFAIAVAEDDYYSGVTVYNSNFNVINKLTMYKYVTALDISKNGEMLVTAGVYIGENGDFKSEITLLETGKEKPKAKINLNGAIVYDCKFSDGGGFVALTDDGLKYYSSKGEQKGSVSFGSDYPSYCKIENGNVILIYSDKNTNNKCRLEAYDKEGRELCSVSLEGGYADMCSLTHQAYVLLEDSVAEISLSSGKIKMYALSDQGLFESGAELTVMCGANEDIYICSSSGAEKLKK